MFEYMEDKRNTLRLMTSLKDLRLNHESNKTIIRQHEAQPRKISKKNLVLKLATEDELMYQNITKLQKKKSPEDLDFIKTCLSTHFIFSQLIKDSTILTYLLDKFFYCSVSKDQFIIKQGDDASSFFIIESGRFQVIINGLSKKQIGNCVGFGQLALLYNSPRSASLRALQNSRLWGIDRTTFKNVVTTICEKQFLQNREFVQNLNFFQYLNSRQKDSISNLLISQNFNYRQRIINKGDPADSLYIIKSGIVKVFNQQKQLIMTAGQIFGQSALLRQNQIRNINAEAVTQCSVLALSRHSVNQILGKNIHVIVFRNKIAEAFKKSSYFSFLPQMTIQKIIDSLKIIKIQKGVSIIKPQSLCRQKMFFILEGIALVSDTNQKIEYGNQFYGERSIKRQFEFDTYSYAINFEKEGFIACTDYITLSQVLKGTYEDIIQKHIHSMNEQKLRGLNLKIFKQQVLKLQLADLYSIKKLGFGQFGTVHLVTDYKKSNLYALKCIEKTQVLNCKLERHVQNQKNVLQVVNHPFIIRFGRSFKDENFLYFLTEYINGMELFEVIRILGLLNTSDSKFYIASLILAVEYLHRNNIVYRDLKPENVMVNYDGYIKLIDMGTSKFLKKDNQMFRTFTIIGTPHYMAPQVLSGKGYSFYADLWSLGVCLYQFMCGFVPFGQDAEDPYVIYQQIVKKKLGFPNYLKDKTAACLMEQLLSKSCEPRLGGSFQCLKTHQWFSGFEWDLLLSKKIKSPYTIPEDKIFNMQELSNLILQQSISKELKPCLVKKLNNRKIDPQWDKNY